MDFKVLDQCRNPDRVKTLLLPTQVDQALKVAQDCFDSLGVLGHDWRFVPCFEARVDLRKFTGIPFATTRVLVA